MLRYCDSCPISVSFWSEILQKIWILFNEHFADISGQIIQQDFEPNFHLKWAASCRRSFDPNSVWGNIETLTIGRTRPTLPKSDFVDAILETFFVISEIFTMYEIGHQQLTHLWLVTNKNRLQHLSTTSM